MSTDDYYRFFSEALYRDKPYKVSKEFIVVKRRFINVPQISCGLIPQKLKVILIEILI